MCDQLDFEELIEVNNRFQKSIHLGLDRRDKEKVSAYIPTRASVQVLKAYFQQFTVEDTTKASMLIGPYGKGKSHLLLVLLALLSKDNQEVWKNSVQNNFIETTIKKIGLVDEEAGKMAGRIVKKNQYYLPVVISGAQRDFHRALLLSLKESLESEGLEDLLPDTYYEEARKVILGWKEGYPKTYEKFCEHLKEKQLDITFFLKSLERFEEESLQLFQKIYPMLTAGSVFEPMVQMDLMVLYQSVNKKLCKDYGYAGIIIIFDEFSKFIEGYDKHRFAQAMDELQNLCELATKSKQERLHIILVAHKAMKEYGNQLPPEVLNNYLGVEGRIRPVYFTTSLKNSYELIEHAIIKKEKFPCVITENLKRQVNKAYELPYFHSMFTKEEFRKIVGEGCFPMTPVSAYLLLKISECAVQNERTVFTFLSYNEPNTLIDFMHREKKFHDNSLHAGYVYDYFSDIFKSDSGNQRIHNEWLKAEYALKQTKNLTEQIVIKTMALVRMVGVTDEMFATDEVILNGSGLELKSYQHAMERLKSAQLIMFRSKTGSYAFKNNIGINMEEEIRQLAQKKYYSLTPQNNELCKRVQELSELIYELPKRYNLEYSMTRYFGYHFMTVEDFMHLTSSQTEYLFEEQFADGKLICLISDQKEDKIQISRHLEELKEERIVLLLPEEPFEKTELVKKILAVKELLSSEEFLENNKALEQECRLYEEDLTFELQSYLEGLYLPFHQKTYVMHKGHIWEPGYYQNGKENVFNSQLSDVLSDYYNRTPRINHEMINRRMVSGPMKKARKNLMLQILGKADFNQYKQGTSPEATIFRAVFSGTGVSFSEDNQENTKKKDGGGKKLLEEIGEFFSQSIGEKQCFLKLYDILEGKGYGIRRGVVPLYLSYVLSQWEGMPVVYLGNKEVTLTTEILENINDTPDKYSLYIEKETREEYEFLQGLERVFQIKAKEGSLEKLYRYQRIDDAIYEWYCSLPQCARSFLPEGLEKDLGERRSKGIEKFRKIYGKIERNPREVLMVTLKRAFEADSYDCLLQDISVIKEIMESQLNWMENQVVKGLYQVFDLAEKNDLLQGLKSMQVSSGYVASGQTIRFLKAVENIQTHQDIQIAEQVSKSILDLYIPDYKKNSLDILTNRLCEVKDEIVGSKKMQHGGSQLIFTNSKGFEVKKSFRMQENDGISEYLENEIESALEEYGDSLETNQKISVMLRMIEKLLEG